MPAQTAVQALANCIWFPWVQHREMLSDALKESHGEMSVHFSGAVCFSVEGSEISFFKMQLEKPLEKMLSFGDTLLL